MDRQTKAELASERTCIVTRAKAAPESLLRFVRAPDGTVVPDLRHKLPGRGVWVTADAKTVAQAVKRKAFARGFKAEVRVSETLPDDVAALMQQACLQSLSLAKKAGEVVAGFTKVAAAAQAGTVAGLISASDGSVDGSRKLRQALRRAGPEVPEIKLFTEAQLSLALGGANVIHAAVTQGAAAQAFLGQRKRLEIYLSGPGAAAATDELAPAAETHSTPAELTKA